MQNNFSMLAPSTDMICGRTSSSGVDRKLRNHVTEMCVLFFRFLMSGDLQPWSFCTAFWKKIVRRTFTKIVFFFYAFLFRVRSQTDGRRGRTPIARSYNSFTSNFTRKCSNWFKVRWYSCTLHSSSLDVKVNWSLNVQHLQDCLSNQCLTNSQWCIKNDFAFFGKEIFSTFQNFNEFHNSQNWNEKQYK